LWAGPTALGGDHPIIFVFLTAGSPRTVLGNICFFVNFVIYPKWQKSIGRFSTKFGYKSTPQEKKKKKKTMKIKFLKYPFIFLATYLKEPCLEIWRFFEICVKLWLLKMVFYFFKT
jgi:hypothetical protein